jgi:hypothetical protein
LKACGLFTAATGKRNPFVEIRRKQRLLRGFMPQYWGLVRLRAGFVTLAQFVDQVLQMGRQARAFRAKALLQPFSHRVADRSASLAIDRFDVVGDSAIHDEFRFLVISFK